MGIELARLCRFFLRASLLLFKPRSAFVAENFGLRSQLAAVGAEIPAGKRPRPRLPPWFRTLWALLSRWWPDWRPCFVLVKPETVLKWHRQGFRLLWRQRSGCVDRPPN
jgi:hypothetical protein